MSVTWLFWQVMYSLVVLVSCYVKLHWFPSYGSVAAVQLEEGVQSVAVCCSVLQCVAVRCSAL